MLLTTMVLVVVGVVIAVRAERRRRDLFTVSRSEAISTVHVDRSRRHTAKTKAALDAATASLR